MRKTLLIALIGVIPILIAASCEKIPTEKWAHLDQTKLTELRSIPLEYGQLKGVTMSEQFPGWAELWFQDDAGTIRMARIDWLKNKMFVEPLTIPRTSASIGGE